MSTAEYVKDDEAGNTEGQCFIPASQRPDGTWRKARRVKDGYVPQEEMPLYESKGKQWAKGRSDYPVGLAPEDAAAAKARQQANDGGIPGLAMTPKTGKQSAKSRSDNSGGLSSADEIAAAKVRQLAKDAGIPGLAVPPKPEKSKSQKKKGGGKKKASAPDASITKKLQDTHISDSTTAEDPQSATADPVKRLRNLRKKLRDIEKLEKQISSGDLKTPDEDQLLKVKKKGEVLKLIKELEKEAGENN